MSGKPWEKYQTAPAQPEAVPATPAGGKPWEKYAQPQVAAPVEASPAPEPQSLNEKARQVAAPVMEGPVGQVGAGVLEGFSGLPGVPLDLMAAGGNFIRRQLDLPETQLKDTWAKDWGSEGFARAARKPINTEAANQAVMPAGMLRIAEMIARNQFAGGGMGIPETPEPVGEAQRIARKGGMFFGGALPFGPAGMLPTATAYAGSEIGRVADQMVPEITKGYGEAAGGVVGGIVPAATKSMLRRPVDTSPAPDKQSIRAEADASYQAADDAGVIIKPDAMERMARDLHQELSDFGYHPKLHPTGAVAIDEISQAIKGGNITLKGVDRIRQVVKDASQPLNWKDKKVAGKVVKRIDDMLAKLTPDDVVAGDPAKGVAALTKARALWARLSKAELVDATFEKATRQASVANSGGNIDNAIRQKFNALLNSPTKLRGFSPDEIAMVKRVAEGRGGTQELLRWAGKMSPRSGGLLTLISLAGIGGGAAVNPWLALPAAGAVAGAIARPVADAMTKGNVRMLSSAVRRGNSFVPRQTKRMLTRAPASVPGTAQQDR